MKFPDSVTTGEKYEPAMWITDEAEARDYFEACVEHTVRVANKTREEAVIIERSNLGYWAGYHDHGVRLRVERLFKCVHPVFGSAEKGPVPFEDAFAMGLKIGQDLKKGGQ